LLPQHPNEANPGLLLTVHTNKRLL